MYVDDFVEDAVKLFKKYHSSEPINICSGELHSIKYIVNLIAELSKFSGDIVYNKDRPETISFKSISNEKISKIVNRQKYTNFNQGLKRTIGWIKDDITRNSKRKA